MRRKAGFTLIEILTALAILSISFGAVAAAVSQAGRGIGTAERRIEAVQLAQSLLAEAITAIDNNGVAGLDDEGQAEQGLEWSRRISAAEPVGAVPDRLARYRIRITVEPGNGARAVVLQSHHLKAGRRL
jgi:prepilin-type N-terminal cleavage/methylation domain-containing protein